MGFLDKIKQQATDVATVVVEKTTDTAKTGQLQMQLRSLKGEEKEAPLDQAIDVGLFMATPDRPEFTAKDVIWLEKRPIKSGDQTIEFVVDRKPAFVGVDPYLKLISRNTSNNVKSLGAKAGS